MTGSTLLDIVFGFEIEPGDPRLERIERGVHTATEFMASGVYLGAHLIFFGVDRAYSGCSGHLPDLSVLTSVRDEPLLIWCYSKIHTLLVPRCRLQTPDRQVEGACRRHARDPVLSVQENNGVLEFGFTDLELTIR